MTQRTETIVTAYLDGMRSRYEWARRDDAAAQRGLAMGEDAARKACAGKLKLEGEAWNAALAAAGFSGRYTMAALASFCAEG